MHGLRGERSKFVPLSWQTTQLWSEPSLFYPKPVASQDEHRPSSWPVFKIPRRKGPRLRDGSAWQLFILCDAKSLQCSRNPNGNHSGADAEIPRFLAAEKPTAATSRAPTGSFQDRFLNCE